MLLWEQKKMAVELPLNMWGSQELLLKMETLVMDVGNFIYTNSGKCRALGPDGSLSVVDTVVDNGRSMFLIRFFLSK